MQTFQGDITGNAGTVTSLSGTVGTTAAGNAAAGNVGEFVTANTIPTQTGLTTNTPANIVSISLTAGDWDVWGSVNVYCAGTTILSYMVGGISVTSATLPVDQWCFKQGYPAAYTPTQNDGGAVAMQRVNIAATTTVYLVVQAGFTTSTAGAGGTLSARRAR